jgi:hypothetical protein
MVVLVPRGVSQAYYIMHIRSLPDFVKCRKRAEDETSTEDFKI